MATLTQTLTFKEAVLTQTLGNELVLLNLDSEEYFGLDDVGTAMWLALKESNSIQAAQARLLEQYEVEPAQLQQDLLKLVEQLVEHGLVEIVDS